MTASLAPRRVDNLVNILSYFCFGSLFTVYRVQELLALMSAAAAVVPLGLLRTHPLQCWFNAFCLNLEEDRQVRLHVSRACIRDLLPLETREVPAPTHRRLVISADVSQTG